MKFHTKKYCYAFTEIVFKCPDSPRVGNDDLYTGGPIAKLHSIMQQMFHFRRDEDEMKKYNDFEVGDFPSITLSTLIGSSVKPESDLHTVAFEIYLRPEVKTDVLDKNVWNF